jgi:hypothetical protein
MIVSHYPDVDPDDYCFDTGLTFAADFGERLLHEFQARPERFERRIKYDRGENYKAFARQIGVDKARELNRRKLQFEQFNPGLQPIKFLQWWMPDALELELYASVPMWLFYLSPGEPKSTLQSGDGGDYLPTHMGHQRVSSLFMLLQGQGQETRWYRQTDAFDVIDPYRIPDHDKLEHVVTAVMEPFRWYAFNHKAWHSVHQFSPSGVRVNMGLDFDQLSMRELVAAIKGGST